MRVRGSISIIFHSIFFTYAVSCTWFSQHITYLASSRAFVLFVPWQLHYNLALSIRFFKPNATFVFPTRMLVRSDPRHCFLLLLFGIRTNISIFWGWVSLLFLRYLLLVLIFHRVPQMFLWRRNRRTIERNREEWEEWQGPQSGRKRIEQRARRVRGRR